MYRYEFWLNTATHTGSLWKGVLGGTLCSLIICPTCSTLASPFRMEERFRTGRASDVPDTSALLCYFL